MYVHIWMAGPREKGRKRYEIGHSCEGQGEESVFNHMEATRGMV